MYASLADYELLQGLRGPMVIANGRAEGEDQITVAARRAVQELERGSIIPRTARVLLVTVHSPWGVPIDTLRDVARVVEPYLRHDGIVLFDQAMDGNQDDEVRVYVTALGFCRVVSGGEAG